MKRLAIICLAALALATGCGGGGAETRRTAPPRPEVGVPVAPTVVQRDRPVPKNLREKTRRLALCTRDQTSRWGPR
jgi:hypothetical protein